ncbi:MAG: winged helix-turn-helix transcriptional regulator, partial [Faecousia sp.]
FLQKNGTITNADVRQMFQVSSATANRILGRMTEEGKIEKIRIGKSWGYMIRQ